MTYSSIKKRFVLFSIFSLLVRVLTAQVAFQETSFSNAEMIIQEEKLPYIIYFYGNWCPSCQLMEETTFKNTKIHQRIEENYVVFKVNAESERGKEWMRIYNVTSVPTTLFYTKEDYLLNRLENPISIRDFLKITADLGKLPKDVVLPKKKAKRLSSSPKKRINSAPQKVFTADLNSTISAIDLEIEHLRELIGTHNTATKKMPTDQLLSTSKDKNLTTKGVNPTAFPSAKTITNQIEACKSLLTGHKNVQKLIDILEDYKSVLTTKQDKPTLKKEVINPPKFKKTSKNTTPTKSTNYQKLYARNQQIISYLKLTAPVKKGNQYIVQLGRYQNIRNAERLVQSIQDKYDYPIKIHIQRQGDAPVQVVYLGEFKTESEAIAANENLKWINRKGVVKQF